MAILDLFLQSFSSVCLLGVLVVLVLIYIVSSSSFSSQKHERESPGPKPLPLLGNLLQLDPKRLYSALLEVRHCPKFTQSIYGRAELRSASRMLD